MIQHTHYGTLLTDTIESSWGANFSIDFVVPLNLVSQWRRCGLISDFLANYHSFEFKNPNKALSILSTTINELLENAVKFSIDKNKLVTLALREIDNWIYIETINYANEENTNRLSQFAVDLSLNSPEDLFYIQLNEAAHATNELSGIGILTILKDYEATFGIDITSKPDETLSCEITTIIGLNRDIIDEM